MTPTARRLAAAVVAVIALATMASSALAGTATVYQCTGPGGQAVSTDMLTPPTPPGAVLYAHCGDPSFPWGLVINKFGWIGGPSLVAGDYGEARVSAPASALITGGTLSRQMLGYHYERKSSDGFGYWLRTAEGATIETCGGVGTPPPDGCQPQPDGLSRFASVTRDIGLIRATPPAAVATPALRFAVGCFVGSGICHVFTGQEGLGIAQMALRVSENEAPVVRSAAGSLVSDTPVRARDIAINASDTGLGLFRVLVYIDGALTEAQPFDPTRPACADVNPASPDAYELPVAPTCAPPARPRAASRSPACPPTENTRSASWSRTPPATRRSPCNAPSPSRCPSTGCAAPPTAASCRARCPTAPTRPPTPR
jgi:hypothetical protein